MDTDPSKSSLDFGDTKSRSPLRKIAEKNVIGRMLSRTKLGAKFSLDESFDMISDFGSPEKRDKKRAREALPPHLSPERKQHRPTSPSGHPGISTAPPVSYRSPKSKYSLPPRLDSRPIPPTPPKSEEPASIPLPASPPKSASSWLCHPPQFGDFGEDRPGTPITQPSSSARAQAQTSPRRSRAHTQPPRSPSSPDIFTEFDRLFADFPHPPIGAIPLRSPQNLPTPALTGTSSAYSSSSTSEHSRPVTPLSAHPPPDPARLESAINTLSQVIRSLQGTQADQATYAVRQEDMVGRAQSMDRELTILRAENLRLEVSVRREREERVRAEKEREDLRLGMKRREARADEDRTKAASSLAAIHSQAQISAQNILTLQSHLSASQSRCAALESHTKGLEGEISRLTGAFEIVQEDYKVKAEEMQRRMDEAEFMHQALKESGARLGRELDGAKKKYSELEKKGRGGFI